MMRVLLWPFAAAWSLVGVIFSAIGRLFSFGMGFAITVIGVVLCMSIVGLVVGVPLVGFGIALLARSIF